MTFKEIISKFENRDKVASLLGVSVHTVRSWSARKSIPAKYWLPLVRHAENEGVDLALKDFTNAMERKSEVTA